MSKDFVVEDVFKVARRRQTGRRHSSVRTIILPQQVTYEGGQERPIRNNVPDTTYLPRNKERRERLIAQIAEINRERDKERERSKRMPRVRR